MVFFSPTVNRALRIAFVLIGIVLAYQMFGQMLFYCTVFFLAALYVQLVVYQENILYIPSPQGFSTCDKNPTGFKSPGEHQISYEDVYFKTPDGVKLHAWWIPASTNSQHCPTLLFCHANAGNIGFRLPNYVKLRKAFDEKINIFAFDYRGYGNSDCDEKPSEIGLTLDAIGASEWLAQLAQKGTINKSNIYIFGRSLGGAVAVALAHAMEKLHDRPSFTPKGIILENTFVSISSAVDHVFPWIPTIVKNQFLRLRWDTEKIIGLLGTPMLLLSGLDDEIIPAAQMATLRNLCTSKIKFASFPGGTHNDTWEKGGEAYDQAWRDFVQ
eukprot:GEMP01044399.1.p1 GENE.GEMP01044399.1~~GEMP01044399.1.p1  ORF type:complete len:352 (+),score=32.11 GEMP01044399.1:76-1056(+)